MWDSPSSKLIQLYANEVFLVVMFNLPQGKTCSPELAILPRLPRLFPGVDMEEFGECDTMQLT